LGCLGYSYCCLPYSARQNRNGRELQHRPSSLSNPPSRSPINSLSLFPRIARLHPTKLVSVPTACPPLEPPAPSYHRVSSSAPPWLHESPIRSEAGKGQRCQANPSTSAMAAVESDAAAPATSICAHWCVVRPVLAPVFSSYVPCFVVRVRHGSMMRLVSWAWI
jgi:hypothetical protein